MQKLKSTSFSLQDDMIIQKDYQEAIFVPEGKTLIIDGQTNRLINVEGGNVIVKGVASRINQFAGKVTIQRNGWVDSLYCGNESSEIEAFGKIHEVYLLRKASLTMKAHSYAIQITNDGARVNIMTNSYIKHYNQFGKLKVP